jgi:hypothetical protein
MTLLELLLALGLITLVATMMFLFYDVSIRSREHGRRVIGESHLARVIAQRIAGEIRSANGFLVGVGPGVGGRAWQITLQTVVLPEREVYRRRSIREDPLPAQCDIRQVQYYLAYDDEQSHDYPDGSIGPRPLGLVRAEVKTPFQTGLAEAREENINVDLLAPEVKYLRFRYFDGVDWLDRWDFSKGLGSGGLGNSLPQAVEVTVGYAEMPPPPEEDEIDFDDSELQPAPPEPYSPQTYTLVVHLPQADAFFGSRLMRAQRRSRAASPPAEAPG